MKKAVVIFAQPIENSTSSMIRSRNIINGLCQLGWEVTCYSPYPDQCNIYYDERIALEPQIRIERYGTSAPSIKSIMEGKAGIKKQIYRRLYFLFKKVDLFGSSIQYIKYRKSIYRKIINQGYQVILSFSNPIVSHIIAGYCKERAKIPYYIQQWGDPLAEDITDHTIVPGFVKRFIEAKLLRNADKICYVSPLTCERQKILFKKYSGRMLFTPTPCEKKYYPLCNNKKMTIGYLGSYNLVARDIRPLYNAACVSRDVNFIFIGDSDVRLESTENIQVIRRLPQKELDQYIEKLDVLVCLMNSGGTQIPGKLYHYAGTNKEILVIRDGENSDRIEDFFKRYNRYTFVDNNRERITEVLRQYVINGLPRRCCVEEFCAVNVAGKLVEGVKI